MKRESDDLKRDIRMLNSENERLVKQVELAKTGKLAAAPGGGHADAETAKRLKKRELETQALWETLKDMYQGSL
jgi:hypothetical protein